MTAYLFVYGTLRPRDVRWPLLEPFVVDEGWDDHVEGHLFDTGLGYPAAVFADRSRAPNDQSSGVRGSLIVGRTVTLLGSALTQALEVLDIEEDTVHGLYRRIEVSTGRGVTAWAYAYGSGLQLTRIESGDWLDHRGPQ